MARIILVRRKKAASVSMLTAVDSASSATSTVSLPTGSQNGDLAVLAVGSSDVITPTISGWTLIGNLIGVTGNVHQAVFYKVLTSGDISAGSVTVPTNGTTRSIILSVRPDIPISSITVGSLNEEGTSGNAAAQTIVATGAASGPLLLIGAFRTSNSMSVTGTLISDGTLASSSGSTTSRMYYLIQNVTLADKDSDLADAGAGNCASSFYLKVA